MVMVMVRVRVKVKVRYLEGPGCTAALKSIRQWLGLG